RCWQSQARLFHQIRSDRVPSFYKQMDTKVIAEFASSAMHLQEVAKRLNLGPTEAVELASLVTVEMHKNKSNVIIIRANYNNPHLAAEIANSVTDVVLAAYIEMQNSTLRSMLDQRQQRRLRLQAKLAELEAAKIMLTSPNTFLSPEQELNRLSDEIVQGMGQVEAGRAEMVQLQAAIAEAERLLTLVPVEVPYLRRIITTDTSAVDSMQTTLDAMRLKYTDANPRVIALASELANARQRMAETVSDEIKPDEVVYIVNHAHTVLVEDKNRVEVQLAGLIKINEIRAKRVAELQKQVPEHLKALGGYLENQRNIETLSTTISQLDSTINDMEMLLNSTVPDLSVLEYAVPSMCPTGSPSKLIIASVSVGCLAAGMLLALFFGWDFAFGSLRSPKNFNLGGNVNFLGMFPARGEVGAKEMDASLQRVFMHMRSYLGQGRRIFLAELSPNGMTPEVRENWNQNFGINGIQAFWLSFSASTKSIKERLKSQARQHCELDDELIAIEKCGNHGVFYCSNTLVLSQAELDLLSADIKTLEPHFSLFIIERDGKGKLYDPIFDQLCQLADYTVLLATFGQDKKSAVAALEDDARLAGHRVGCVLTDVPKKYWNILQS
ncbi:MAG TPA: hypothetical protein PKY10_03480, partial [Lentisphaeria bacterium]|nr:hypothetical protein [Lentisphaeria bacterium]